VGDGLLRAARSVLTPERGYYLSQIYPIALSIIATPFFLRFLGESGYAVITFGNVLLNWATLLELGFSAALSRWLMLQVDNSTRHSADTRSTVSAVFVLSMVVGVLIFGGLAASSGWIASHWLNISDADPRDVEPALMAMALMLFGRWAGTVPRAVLYGQRRLVFLAWHSYLFSSLRQIGWIPLLYWWQGGLVQFFLFQVIVSVVEMLVLIWPNQAVLRPAGVRTLRDSVNALRPLAGMAFSLAGTSLLWLLVSQTDRLVLSSMISLHDYGVYSVAMVVAGGIPSLIGPLTLVLLPRLVAEVQASVNERETVLAYRRIVVRMIPLGLSLGFGMAAVAQPLIGMWTGDRMLAAAAAPILAIYALGNGIQVVSGLPYFLQYAKGDLRLHLIGNVGFALLFLLGMLVMVPVYGAVGAGLCWLLLQIFYSTIWVSFVHRRLVPSYWRVFLWGDVLPSLLLAMALGSAVMYLQTMMDGWSYLVVSFAMVSCMTIAGLSNRLAIKI